MGNCCCHKTSTEKNEKKSRNGGPQMRRNGFSNQGFEENRQTETHNIQAPDLSVYKYPFENIVFEGGGARGFSYVGCVQVLEELNVYGQIRRFAGSSIGAITAACCAIGCDSNDLEEFARADLKKLVYDAKCGMFCMPCNMMSSYGWNPGKKFEDALGKLIAKKTNDPDTTFEQVYKNTGKELCIVVVNLNHMAELYCHVKTTPDMPIRRAVRMSMSIPGLFAPVEDTMEGSKDLFIDGGLLCCYPLHCYDGWWLSMQTEHSFIEQLQPLEDVPKRMEHSDRFGTRNEKTLGFRLFSEEEYKLTRFRLDKEMQLHSTELSAIPDTQLGIHKKKLIKVKTEENMKEALVLKSMNSFLQALNKHNSDPDSVHVITIGEFEAAMNDTELFSMTDRRMLFGEVESRKIFQDLDTDNNGEINFNELMDFMKQHGVSMHNRFVGCERQNIDSLTSYWGTIVASLLLNESRLYNKKLDFSRTVGVNTGHIGTVDFDLEPADVDFLIERARQCTEAFLWNFVDAQKNMGPEVTMQDMNPGSLESQGDPEVANFHVGKGSTEIQKETGITRFKMDPGSTEIQVEPELIRCQIDHKVTNLQKGPCLIIEQSNPEVTTLQMDEEKGLQVNQNKSKVVSEVTSVDMDSEDTRL